MPRSSWKSTEPNASRTTPGAVAIGFTFESPRALSINGIDRCGGRGLPDRGDRLGPFGLGQHHALHARQTEQQQVVPERIGVSTVDAQVRSTAGREPFSDGTPRGGLVSRGNRILEIDEDHVGARTQRRLEAVRAVTRYEKVRAVSQLT